MAKKPINRNEEAPLEGLRLVLNKQAIHLDPLVNQVSNLPPADQQLEYYFVPRQFMTEYKAYNRPGKPLKNLKLVNYDKPAISVSFFYKHKYSIERQVTHQDVVQHIKNYRDELLNRSLMQQLSSSQQRELQQTDELLRTIRQQPDAYQACFSNYYHKYYYWYCTYRYFEKDELTGAITTKTSTSSEHLLKHTERVGHPVHERLNIIFIDPEYINESVPHDQKVIDRELTTYPIKLRQGVTTLYLREKDKL
ncbi:hypothetical protein [Spirosoma sp. KNUC1025]|uniref:hypothetical protein n=1 Tax=Spirosoma sp. KNUC1025 TaxID=2894082 RepID=UPI001E37BF10|nr:hypothetical protein [Spirosoma sp. KNUC1025]UFH57651.1 hypothetical protein LN737_30665 [Spirosoma sp. KNUC1025]